MRQTEKKLYANEIIAKRQKTVSKKIKIKKISRRRSPHRWAFPRGGVLKYILESVFALCGNYKRNKYNTEI